MTVSIGIILILCLYTVVGVLDQISIQITHIHHCLLQLLLA